MPASRCPVSPLVEAFEPGEQLRADRRAAFPLGAALSLRDLETHSGGIELQRQLQEREPVTWFDEISAWLVTSRQLVEEVLSDHERFTVHARPSFVLSVLGDHMLSRDGEEARHHRLPFDPSFRLRTVRDDHTDLIAGLTESLLLGLRPAGRAELRSQFANPLAVAVSGRALGLAFDDVEEIGRTYDRFAERMVDYSHDLGSTVDDRTRLDATIQRNLDRLRDAPEGCVLSTVLARSGTGLARPDDEIIGNVRILLFGAIETVTSIILSTTWALLTHPDQLATVRDDPSLVQPAVNEALRWVSPVGHTERWATCDTTIGTAEIRTGDMVLPSLAAANRDRSFFDDPDDFDLRRANARHHLAFGKGRHHCIGLNLGQLEAQIAVERMFALLHGLSLAEGEDTVPTGFGFRSPSSLEVTWDV